jgi:hypothetical protein
MTRQATPKAIEAYREKLLTNPASLLKNMRRTRETLRERSEQVFIERDLTASDKAVDEDTRKAEFERLDEQILRVGARIDDLDKQIEAHNKAHPDAELAAKLMPPGGHEHLRQPPAPTPVKLPRKQRREMERATSKSEAKRLTALGAPAEGTPTEPDPAAKPAPMPVPTAEETPKAE